MAGLLYALFTSASSPLLGTPISNRGHSQLASTLRIVSSATQTHTVHTGTTTQAPEIVTIHGLTVPPSLIRSRIRAEFERHKYVQDSAVIDVQIQKSRQDFQEVMNAWAQESHILGVLLKDKSVERKTFLQKFYEGRDEEAVAIASPQTSYP